MNALLRNLGTEHRNLTDKYWLGQYRFCSGTINAAFDRTVYLVNGLLSNQISDLFCALNENWSWKKMDTYEIRYLWGFCKEGYFRVECLEKEAMSDRCQNPQNLDTNIIIDTVLLWICIFEFLTLLQRSVSDMPYTVFIIKWTEKATQYQRHCDCVMWCRE